MDEPSCQHFARKWQLRSILLIRFAPRTFAITLSDFAFFHCQTSNAFSFDGLVKYRTQFEYLYDVLAAAPKDVGVIVTEHPYGEPVLKRSGPYANIEALRGTFSNLIFLDEFRRYELPSQFLVRQVDGVWTVHSRIFLLCSAVASPRTLILFWLGCSSATSCLRPCWRTAAGSMTISSVGLMRRVRRPIRSMRSCRLPTRITLWKHGSLKHGNLRG